MKKNIYAIAALFFAVQLHAIDIIVDYTYDTNGFFNDSVKRGALQAVANRYSQVIDSTLSAVGPSGTGTGTSSGWRIGFTHPGTGLNFEISTASDAGSDPLLALGSSVSAADVYGFGGLLADQWILYAGGRSLSSAGIGGTSTGTNFTSVFDDINGPMHRGIDDNTPGVDTTTKDLPRWGGFISFNSDTSWNFDLSSAGEGEDTDFYSIAMHEVGHALGLSTTWNQWQDNGSGVYVGNNAIAAYNADNDTALSSLNLVDPDNPHWQDGAYESFIFAAGNPNTIGTVPNGTKQDLLMEPIANFDESKSRFELTNVDVAALEDLGWAVVVPETSQLLMPITLGFGAILLRRRKTAHHSTSLEKV